ncbi:MAG: bifunctional pyr operon transcriptional regulator/uracil phosphoribosyltransferase PyrR [Mariprofundus sp.]|nr:bifunctional pyr operon transcriptional regulator/uracil phosphoribosyltransferase PyrR [Mariprofundus sp.]
MSKVVLFEHQAVATALDQMASEIADRVAETEVCLIGIQRGGAKVADVIQQRLEQAGSSVCRGNLDISFYRDDLDTIGPNPEVRPSDLPFDVSGKHIWLVDDVLYTGRTIRAAMDVLFDYGRPASIRLAVLVDRGGRQLPICAHCTGLLHAAPADCTVDLITAEIWRIEQRQVK